MSRKILSLILSFTLLFSQTGFAQVAGQLNIAAYLGTLHQPPIDKLRLPHLRYFSYDNLNNNFRIILDKGDLKEIKGLELQDSAGELLKYFLIGITLPNEAFWVNLRPDSADNIIDDWLAQTDVGKILLEADLQLKKDTARFTSPQTPEGKLYWDKLYKKAEELFGSENISIPTLTRPWIVPGEVIIRETDTSAYVYKATLKVMLEEDHLRDSPLRGQSLYSFTDPRLKALNEYSSQLIRQLIIPKLTKEVNISKRYAELRQVYYSLILSRWFKARFYGKGGIYSWAIDKKNLNGLTSQGQWSKTTYFKEYQNSFKQGEYNLQTPVGGRTGQNIRSYFSGGIDVTAASPVSGGFSGKMTGFVEMLSGNGTNVPASGQAPSNLTTLLPEKVQMGVAASPVDMTNTQFLRLEAIGIIHDIGDIGLAYNKPKLQDNFHRLELTDIYADLIQEMIENPSKVLKWLQESGRQLADFRAQGRRDADWFVQRAGLEAIKVLAVGDEAFIPRISKPIEIWNWNKAFLRFIGLIRISLQHTSGENQDMALHAIVNVPRSKWLSWEQLPEDLRAHIKQQLIQTASDSGIELQLRISVIMALGHLRTEQEVKDCLHTLSVSGTPETIRKRAKTILDRWRSDSAASPVVIDAKNMKEGEDRDIVKRGKVHVYFYYDNKYHVERTLCITGKKDGREIYFTFHFEKPLFSKTSAKDAFFYQARPPYAHSHNIEATINDWHSFIKTLAVQSNEKDRTIEIRVRNEDISALRQLETDNPGLSLENIHLEGDERFNTIKFVTEFSAAASPVEQVQGQGQSPSTPEIGRTGTVPKGISASPAKENFGDSPLRGQSPLNPGGIDFRSIPLIVQPIGNFSNLKFDNLPNTLTLQKLNLDEEFREISSMIAKGILPSGQRVKEYILACFYKKELSQRIDDLILCLTDICRLEEELAQESEPELKESLMLVEAAGVS